MKRKIHHHISLTSTNKIAFKLALQGASDGEVVRAEGQKCGRGRLGKAWHSPAGKGLYFSLIVRPRLVNEDYPKITMTTGLAIAQVLENLCGLDVQLKWPNDIFLSGKKCCGILTEASVTSSGEGDRFAVIGIGLNVLMEEQDFDQALTDSATSLLLETGIRYSMDNLLMTICDEIEYHLTKLENEGFSPILQGWKKRDCLQGRLLRWVTNNGKVVEGVSQGPNKDGCLLVRDREGILHQVISGDISIASSE